MVAAIVAAEVPARVSFHAGTHLCNLTLYTFLGALSGRQPSPLGFLHLPYLPEQITWMMRRGRGATEGAPRSPPLELPSMALETQVKAVRAAIARARPPGGRRLPRNACNRKEIST